MRYRTNIELPPAIRSHLPEHVQDHYREAYNFAYAAYAGDAERDKQAHVVAWAAVKRIFDKDGKQWIQKQSASG